MAYNGEYAIKPNQTHPNLISYETLYNENLYHYEVFITKIYCSDAL